MKFILFFFCLWGFLCRLGNIFNFNMHAGRCRRAAPVAGGVVFGFGVHQLKFSWPLYLVIVRVYFLFSLLYIKIQILLRDL